MHLLLNYVFNVFQTTHLGHNKSVKTLFFIFRLYDRVNNRDIQIIIFFKLGMIISKCHKQAFKVNDVKKDGLKVDGLKMDVQKVDG